MREINYNNEIYKIGDSVKVILINNAFIKGKIKYLDERRMTVSKYGFLLDEIKCIRKVKRFN